MFRMKLRFVRIEPFVLPKRNLTGDSLERVDTRVLQVIYEFDRPKFFKSFYTSYVGIRLPHGQRRHFHGCT